MRTRTNLQVALIAVAIASTMACAGRQANIDTTVTYVATYGERATQILSEAQDLVIKATPTIIPKDATAKAMVQFKTAGEVATKLADALAAYDALAADNVVARTAAISDIRALMDELRRYTRVVLVFVGDNPVGQQMLKLFDNLDSVFQEIQAGFDKWAVAQ